MVVAVETDASQAEVMVLAKLSAANATASQAAAFALGNFPAQFGEASQVALQNLYDAGGDSAQVSMAEVLVLCRGSADAHRLRVWTFTLDGHPFYVLRLGMGGTVVYDQATQRWSEWRSFEKTYWRAHLGMNWDEAMIAGDALEGQIWDIDPTSHSDDGATPIERICVGGFPMRLRNALGCNGIMLTGSVGISSGVVSVRLRSSDDNGNSWFDHGTLSQDLTGQYNAEVRWDSLGTIHAPGRIFEIYDTGVMIRIDGMDMF